jgi:hypothetical protein
MDRKTTALNQLNLGANEPGSAAASKESLRDLICAATVKECTRQLDGRLSAVVLTGSLARDEASFARLAEGWELYGDAEFLVVTKNGCNPPSGEHKAQIRAAIEESLAGAQMKGSVELGFVSPVFFSRLPEHIFSYELKHLGRVVGRN